MTKYPLAVYCDYSDAHFEYGTAARLARVTEEFILKCEGEDLVTCRRMLHGKKGLCAGDVYRLKMIRYLHEDMGLDLEVVDLILRYHDRVVQLRKRLDAMEKRFRREEQARLAEIMALERRLSKSEGVPPYPRDLT